MISDVRITLTADPADPVAAYARFLVGDCIVVKDVRVVRCDDRLTLAMPCRKVYDRCPTCAAKTAVEARYCHACGARLADGRSARDGRGRKHLYADLAHPVDAAARDEVEHAVFGAYRSAVLARHAAAYEGAGAGAA